MEKFSDKKALNYGRSYEKSLEIYLDKLYVDLEHVHMELFELEQRGKLRPKTADFKELSKP